MLAKMIKKIPPTKFNVLKSLCVFLHKTSAQHHAFNENTYMSSPYFTQHAAMDIIDADSGPSGCSLIATIISPSICRLAEHESSYMSIRHNRDLKNIRPVVEFLIEHQSEIFKGLVPAMVPVVVPKASTMRSYNYSSTHGAYEDVVMSSDTVTNERADAKYAYDNDMDMGLTSGGIIGDDIAEEGRCGGEKSSDKNAPYIPQLAIPEGHSSHLNSVNINSWEWKVFEYLVSGTVHSYVNGTSAIDTYSSSGHSPNTNITTNATLSPCPSFSYSLQRKSSITSEEDYEAPFDFNMVDDSMTGGELRKSMVMECRKLRNQIHKFEEDFGVSHNGRVPKGSERGAMQSVYAKYRNLKKEIRNLAVIEIQRVGRGFIARKNYRNNSLSNMVTEFKHSPTKRDAKSEDKRLFHDSVGVRGSYEGDNLGLRDMENDMQNEDSSGHVIMEPLRSMEAVAGDRERGSESIPMEVSQPLSNTPPLTTPSLHPNTDSLSKSGGGSKEDILSLSSTLDANTIHLNKSNMNENAGPASTGMANLAGAGVRPLTPAVSSAGTSAGLLSDTAINAPVRAGGTGGTSGSSDLHARYKELLKEKRDLKKHLKRFDEDFAAKNGRLPFKAEKEIMRPMYQKYHEIKHDMDTLRVSIENKYGPMPSDDEQDGTASDSEGLGAGRKDRGDVFASVSDSKSTKSRKSNSSKGTAGSISLPTLPFRNQLPMSLAALT